MDHITIPIPEDMDAAQKAELVRWLEYPVELATTQRRPAEAQPEWQAEAVRRIRAGMADLEAERVLASTEVRRRLDRKLNRPRPE